MNDDLSGVRMGSAIYILKAIVAGDRFYQALASITPERAQRMLDALEG
jgi:hypothetical protein